MVPDTMTGLWLLLAPCLPLALAFALTIRAWRCRALPLIPWMALPVILIPLLLEPGVRLNLPWLLLGVRLGLDPIAAPLMLGTGFVWFAAAWYARNTSEVPRPGDGFWRFFLLAMAGNVGLLVAQDMLSFFLCYALMGLAAYGLVIHKRDAAARRAGRIYIILLVTGETLLFAALLMAASASGTLAFSRAENASLSGVMVALIVFGFGIKAGLLPVHVSLPLAYTAAPTPATIALAGAMINAGLVGWLRFLPLSGSGYPEWGAFMVVAGLVAAFYGVLVGITQSDPKTLLAYSSISQMGLITAGVGAGLMVPAAWATIFPVVLLYALHHALAKGALFFGLGLVRGSAGTTGPARRFIRLSLWLPALALAGLPLTSGALAKGAFKVAMAPLPAPWPGLLAILLPLAAVGTTLLMIRFLKLIPATAKPEVSWSVHVMWGLLLASGLVVPWFWFGDLPAAAAAISPHRLWLDLWPIGMGMLIAGGAVVVCRNLDLRRRLEIPAGDVLVLAESVTAELAPRRLYARRPEPARRASISIYGGAMAARLGEVLRHVESLQRAWRTAGAAFLLVCMLVMLGLLRA